MNNFQKKYISKNILNNPNSFSSFLKEGKHEEEMKKLLGLGMDIAMGLSMSREDQRTAEAKQKELQIRSLRQSAAIRASADRKRAQAAENLSRARSAYYDAKAAEASFRASQIEQEVNKDEINARREAQDASIPNINPPSRGRGRKAISQIAQPVVPVKAIPDPTDLEVLKSRLPGGESSVSRVFPNDFPLWRLAGVDPDTGVSTNTPSEIPQTPSTSTVETRQRKMRNASGHTPENKNNENGSESVKTPAPVKTPVPVESASGSQPGKAIRGNMENFARIMGTSIVDGDKGPKNKGRKNKGPENKGPKNKGPKGRLPKHQQIADEIKRENLRNMRENKTNESVSYLLNYILKG